LVVTPPFLHPARILVKAEARAAALANGGRIDEPAGAVTERQPVSLGRDPEGNVIEVWTR